jgi:hypothetical protein
MTGSRMGMELVHSVIWLEASCLEPIHNFHMKANDWKLDGLGTSLIMLYGWKPVALNQSIKVSCSFI